MQIRDEFGDKVEIECELCSSQVVSIHRLASGNNAVKIFHELEEAQARTLNKALNTLNQLPIEDLPFALPKTALDMTYRGYILEIPKEYIPLAGLSLSETNDDSEWELDIGESDIESRLEILLSIADVLKKLNDRGLVYGIPLEDNIFISNMEGVFKALLVEPEGIMYESSPGRQGFRARESSALGVQNGHTGVNSLTSAYDFAFLFFKVLTSRDLSDSELGGLFGEETAPGTDISSSETRLQEVLYTNIKELGQRTFASRSDEEARPPSIEEWHSSIRAAIEDFITCPHCGGSYCYRHLRCPWCGEERGDLLIVRLYIWDDELWHDGRPKSDKSIILAGQNIALEGSPLIIDGGSAFCRLDESAGESIIEASLERDLLKMRSVNGRSYRFIAPSCPQEQIVGESHLAIELPGNTTVGFLRFYKDKGLYPKVHRVATFRHHSRG